MVAILVKERFLLSYGRLNNVTWQSIYIYKEYTQPNSQGSSLWNALENGFFHQTYTLYTLRFHSGPQAACDNVTSAGRLTLTKQMLNWKLDITNHYITKSSVQRTIFFTLVIVKYMENNLDITKPRNEQILPVPWLFVISRCHCSNFNSKSSLTHDKNEGGG